MNEEQRRGVYQFNRPCKVAVKTLHSCSPANSFSENKGKQVEKSMVENQHSQQKDCQNVLDGKELDV